MKRPQPVHVEHRTLKHSASDLGTPRHKTTPLLKLKKLPSFGAIQEASGYTGRSSTPTALSRQHSQA
eukprot:3919904-Rhodomonas_salina.3